MNQSASAQNTTPPIPDCLSAKQVALLYGDNLPLLQQCTRSYCSSLEGWALDYQNACARLDSEQARTLAHKLKGAAANLGDRILSELAATQERAHRAGEWGDARQLTALFSAHLQNLNSWLVQQRSVNAPPASKPALDSSAMLRVLSELKPMLERHAFIDAAMIDRLQPLLQSDAYNDKAEKLTVSLDTFDYASALQHCTRIIRELEDDI